MLPDCFAMLAMTNELNNKISHIVRNEAFLSFLRRHQIAASE